MKFNNSKSLFILLNIFILAVFLRFYKLGQIPPSLYSDEAAQGYNAYSILNSGRDEHGAFLPVSLRSFGDWKPPLPAYLMLMAIAVNGLNEVSVRFPSALLGTLTVLLAYLFLLKLLDKFKPKNKIASLAAFILAISPWHILQSRSAMLVMVSLFFLLSGSLLFLLGTKRNKNYYFACLCLSLSVYAYYAMRVVTPLIFLYLIFNQRKFFFRGKIWLYSFLIIFLFSLPLFTGFINNPDILLGRAKTVSVFYDRGVVLRMWELITQDGISAGPLIVRFFHNRWYLYAKEIIHNFLVHFDPGYLFLTGDQSQPFNIPGMGILYFIEALFLPSGVYLYMRKNLSGKYLIILWLIVSVIPASLTFMIPSSNRTFNAVLPLTVFIAVGIYFLNSIYKTKYSAILISLFYIINIYYFLGIYFIKMPQQYSSIWNYGWKEAVNYASSVEQNYRNIYVSDIDGMPYIYFLFYKKYDPLKFRQTVIRSYSSDRFGFEHVESFDKYIFISDSHWQSDLQDNNPDSLYIITSKQLHTQEQRGLEINYPDGKEAIRIIKQ